MAVGIVTMLLGMVVALTLVLAACGGGQVDAYQSGMTFGKIAKSELGPGKTASAWLELLGVVPSIVSTGYEVELLELAVDDRVRVQP